MRIATARAYSSSANLGPGFDTMGLAHDAGSTKISVELVENSPKVELELNSGDLPSNPLENTASLAVKNVLETRGINGKFRICISSDIPLGLGLGSSGASAAAAVVAIDSLMDIGLSMDEKVNFAMLGETASSGTPHADNVAAAVYGGLVMVESTNPMKIRPLKINRKFSFLTILPNMNIPGKTRISRTLVPSEITMSQHIWGIRHTSLMVSGFINGDRDALRAGMNDHIVEASRMQMFPFYPAVKKVALENEAAGVCISGAGPSILVVVDRKTDLDSILSGTGDVLKSSGIGYSVLNSNLAGGAYITEN